VINDEIDAVVVHCSASPHGRGDDAETIHRWHVIGNGWDGIGYHWVIAEDGTVQPGRPWYWTGAHVRGHNSNALGVCLVGDHDFTGEQLHALRALYEEIREAWPRAKWFNHYDLDPDKTCPNFDAVAFLEDE